ncbi:hypothetical protein H3009_gp19 [Bacillus phage Harambe]|uniref:Uncharacterized protein n=1 Tax=Bacillus phage Harambe TaxID=1981931 RepID=A0A1W6JSB8_9CAUD|nr:hypothetical protein H3009_gp19 [Bacillus phage Harambe]ARM70168.1 hypothetical protein HARAMBE_19 [Bacillus phage Harambe]
MGNWEDSVNKPTDLVEGDKVTALQYINEASKSDVTEWTFPPLAPTVNEMHMSPPIHVEGEGIPNYWIHMRHNQSGGGGESDTFRVGSDGKFRSINPLLNPNVGDTVIVRQSQSEFDGEEKQSKETIITIKD